MGSSAGQRVLITGGARGIGRATARAYLQRGARVVVTDRDTSVLDETAEALGDGVDARTLDVTDADAFRAVVADLQSSGPIDVLVNNAGIMSLGGFLDQDPINDERQIAVNLRGVINGMRAALPAMRDRGRGHVVNVASMAAKVPVPYAATYTATKHAVAGLTEAVRSELNGSGVHLSYVMPIPVNTDLILGVPKMRWPPAVEPEDVANAIVRATERGEVDVFVPRLHRVTATLPALLPRRALEHLARLFGVDELFGRVDEDARAAYVRRSSSDS